MLNEVEAAQALGGLVRERAAAGLPGGLNEVQTALFLGSLAEVRSLPEVTPARSVMPRPRMTQPRKKSRRRLRAGADLLGRSG